MQHNRWDLADTQSAGGLCATARIAALYKASAIAPAQSFFQKMQKTD